MFRRCLAPHLSLLGMTPIVLFGCAKDLDTTDPIDASRVVRAQFDPSHPIPVLRLVPSPTALVQDPLTGELVKDLVAAQPCELPTTKQCLQFVSGGWPVTAPITLFFSGELDETTVEGNVLLLEAPRGGSPFPLPYTFTVEPRPAPNEACMQGGNGSTRTYGPELVPEGVQLVLEPLQPLKDGTEYFLVVKRTLKSKAGTAVEPAALFSLLNEPENNAPVKADGTIESALLRSNVQATVLALSFGGKTITQLNAEEKVMFEEGVRATGARLFGLYQFFASVIARVEATVPRADIIFANRWSTAPAPSPVIEFDPANPIAPKIPFPNVQLLTVTSTDVRGGVRVNLPNPTGSAVIAGLNTLNGFSTTAPMAITASADVDPMTIDATSQIPCTSGGSCIVSCSPDDCAIVMYPLGDDDVIDGPAVPLIVKTSTETSLAPATIAIVPAVPLLPNKEYVVAVKRGIKTISGQSLASSQTFDFLKIEKPFIDSTNAVLADPITPEGIGTFEQALECSFVPEKNALGNASEVQGRATLLEQALQHSRWLIAFEALETPSQPNFGTAIPRTSLLMAWTYKTQDITDTVDSVKSGLIESGAWEMIPNALPRVIGPLPGLDIRGRTAITQTIRLVETVCVPLCEAGATQIPISQCATRNAQGTITSVHPDLASQQLCLVASNLSTSHLGRVRLHLLKGYKATSGSPFQSGTFTAGTIARPELVDIPIWVVTATGTVPQSGFPIAIFQHAIGANKETGFYIANALARRGWATVLIDLPFHGSRASDLVTNATGAPCPIDPSQVVCTSTASCVRRGTTTPACDGLQDPSGTGFLSANLFATRDNLRQATIDHLTLLRALRLEARASGALSDLDGSRIGFIGQSLGGVTAANLAAYVTESELEGIVVNVSGGGLVNNILLSTIPQISTPLFLGLAQAGACELRNPQDPTQGCKDTPAFRQFQIIGQWVLDPGDPLANAVGASTQLPMRPQPFGAGKVLLQVAQPDPVFSNASSRALASAFGFRTDGTDDHYQIYDFATLPSATQGSGCHPFLLAPVCGRCLIDTICQTVGAQTQAAGFIDSGATTIESKVSNAFGFNCDNPCP